MVEKFTNFYQVVMKVGHYVDDIDGELWEDQVIGYQGNVRGATGGANYKLESIGADVGTGCARGHIEVTRTRVGNVRVRLGYQGRGKGRSGAISRVNKSRFG